MNRTSTLTLVAVGRWTGSEPVVQNLSRTRPPRVEPMPVFPITGCQGVRHTIEPRVSEPGQAWDSSHPLGFLSACAVVLAWTRVHDAVTYDTWRPKFAAAAAVR